MTERQLRAGQDCDWLYRRF